jgi:uncharacterized protein (TIGR02099 family)
MVKKSIYWLYKTTLYSVWIFIVLLTASIITLRYFMLPDVDQYKPKIESEISKNLGQKITIGKINSNWHGLNPNISMRNINIYDQDANVALSFDRIDASLSWLSIPLLEPRFSSINIFHPQLLIKKNMDGTVNVAGISTNETSNSDFPNWILKQSEFNVLDANVVWQDDFRGAPPLSLNHLNLRLQNPSWDSMRGRHRFSFKAIPSAGEAKFIDIRGNVFGKDINQLSNWHGSLFGSINTNDISAWKPWVDYPFDLTAGQGITKIWVDFKNAKATKLTADIALHQVISRLKLNDQESIFNHLIGRLNWQQFKDGQSLSGERLYISTSDGLDINNGNFSLRGKTVKNEERLAASIQLNKIQLQALNKLKSYFPLPEKLTQAIDEIQPQGTLDDLQMSWENNKDSLEKYALKTNFTNLSMQTFPPLKIPGFNNLKGSIEVNETNGKITLDTEQSSVNDERLFRWPIAFNNIKGKITWRNNQSKYNVHITQLAFRTPDLSGVIDGYFSGGDTTNPYVDLTGHIDEVRLKNTKYYLPNTLSEDTLNWIDTSILDGVATDAKLTLKGNPDEFPFIDGKKGIFRVTAKAHNVLLDHTTDWPKINGIKMSLLFEGKRMEINAIEGNAYGNQIIKAKVSIPDLMEDETKLDISGEVQGDISDGINYINASPIAKMADDFTRQLKTTGKGKLSLNIHIPLYHLDQTIVNGTYAILNASMASDMIPEISKINGELKFTDHSIDMKNINALIFDGPAQFNLATDKNHAIQITGRGKLNDIGLKKYYPSIPKSISGASEWELNGHIAENKNEIKLSSNLIGLSSSLPPPLNKNAKDTLTLLIEKKQNSKTQDLIKIKLGNEVAGQFITSTVDGVNKIDRGEIGIHSTPEIPSQKGITLKGKFAYLDMDDWLSHIDKSNDKTSYSSQFAINQVELSADHFDLFDRRFNEFKLKAKLNDHAWLLNVNSQELIGDIKWVKDGHGKVIANLNQLKLPATSPDAVLKEKVPLKQLNLKYPALDLNADNFEIGEKKFGRLELQAQEQKGSWSINQLRISNPDGVITANGEWNNWKRRPNTMLRFNWDLNNIGNGLKRLNYPNLIKGGTAKINGQLSWDGSPHEFDIPNLSGTLKLEAKKGQILQVEPGVGRLFSVLSLQNLPRRLSLDFKDLFSTGFSFDKISADVQIERGIMRSDNFKMEGPTARVEIKGETDLDKETQHLYVKAMPFISDTLSLAAFAGGPAVGAAAYIAQKVLKDPLNKIAESEYEIVGTWSKPEEKESESVLSIPGRSIFKNK